MRPPTTLGLVLCLVMGVVRAYPPSPVPAAASVPDLGARIVRLKAGCAAVVFPDQPAYPHPDERAPRPSGYLLAVPRGPGQARGTGFSRNAADPGRVAYAYDKASRLTTMTADITGQTVAYEYGPRHELVGLTVTGAGASRAFTFEYDDLLRRTRLVRPNGVETRYTYDRAGRPTALHHSRGGTVVERAEYSYNLERAPETITDAAGVHRFTYDASGQLLTASHPDRPAETFAYDTVGNHTGEGQTVDAANRLVADNGATYEYNANGGLARRTDKATGETTAYEYDRQQRLARITLPSGRRLDFTYDASGARLSQTTPESTSCFVYSGEDIVAVTDHAASLVTAFLHGPGTDEHLALQTAAGDTYYYLCDGLGSVQALVDGAGAVVEAYRYSAFGQTTVLNGAGDPIPVSALGNLYAFTGRELGEPGVPYYYRARYYDPGARRFISEDPLGLGANDVNFFRYVGNAPTADSDPSGLADANQCPSTASPSTGGWVPLRKDDSVEVKNGPPAKVVLLIGKAWYRRRDFMLKTDKHSVVKLLYADKTQLTLAPDSEMVLATFAKSNPGIIDRLNGQLQNKVIEGVNNQDGQELFIKTKSAAIGVRG